MSARDGRRPEMLPEEQAAYDAWWNGLTKQGDPLHRPWLIREAFHAGWNTRAPSPRDQASSAMLEALVRANAMIGELCTRIARADCDASERGDSNAWEAIADLPMNGFLASYRDEFEAAIAAARSAGIDPQKAEG